MLTHRVLGSSRLVRLAQVIPPYAELSMSSIRDLFAPLQNEKTIVMWQYFGQTNHSASDNRWKSNHRSNRFLVHNSSLLSAS